MHNSQLPGAKLILILFAVHEYNGALKGVRISDGTTACVILTGVTTNLTSSIYVSWPLIWSKWSLLGLK